MIGEIIKLEISATSVAWYGAIVATASVIATGYNVLRDRAKLRIDIKPNMKVYPNTTPTCLCVNNKHIMLVLFGLIL